MSIPILMYHRVCDDRAEVPESPFVVSASVFERQMQWMVEHGYRSVGAEELATLEPSSSERRVIITFDDGYLDNYEVAFPILARHGMTATIFVIGELWRRTAFWPAVSGLAGAPLLSPSQIREMARAGISFGSHCRTHARLVGLSDEALQDELARSKDLVEQILGAPIRSFAYPYGELDARVKGMVQEAGYEIAYGVDSGPFDNRADLFEVRRTHMGNSAAPAYLHAKLSGLEAAVRHFAAPMLRAARAAGLW